MTLKTEGTIIGKLNKDVKKMSDKEGDEPRMKTHKNIITPQVISKLKPNIENFILFLSEINMDEVDPKRNETTQKMPIAK
jgi:hypothetical protein